MRICRHHNLNCVKCGTVFHGTFGNTGRPIRFNSGFEKIPLMSKIKQIAAWVAIIGGGIGFFFFSQFMAEVMR